MKIRNVLARNIERFRNAKGLTKADVVKAADIDTSYFYAILGSNQSASIDVVAAIARALDTTAAALLDENL